MNRRALLSAFLAAPVAVRLAPFVKPAYTSIDELIAALEADTAAWRDFDDPWLDEPPTQELLDAFQEAAAHG